MYIVSFLHLNISHSAKILHPTSQFDTNSSLMSSHCDRDSLKMDSASLMPDTHHPMVLQTPGASKALEVVSSFADLAKAHGPDASCQKFTKSPGLLQGIESSNCGCFNLTSRIHNIREHFAARSKKEKLPRSILKAQKTLSNIRIENNVHTGECKDINPAINICAQFISNDHREISKPIRTNAERNLICDSEKSNERYKEHVEKKTIPSPLL